LWRGSQAQTGKFLLSVDVRKGVARQPDGAIQTIHPEGTLTPVATIVLDVDVGIVGKRADRRAPPILSRHRAPRRGHFVDCTREQRVHAGNPGLQAGRPLCVGGAGHSRQQKERKNSNSHRNLERRELFTTNSTVCMIRKRQVNASALRINLFLKVSSGPRLERMVVAGLPELHLTFK